MSETGGGEGTDASIPGKIRKRRMLQIALIYLGAGWLCVEITDFIVGNYGFSRKILDTVVFLSILGFPAFLIIGWFHGEKGPQRIRRAERWLLVTLASLGAIGTYRIATAEPTAGDGVEAPAVRAAADGTGDAITAAGEMPDLGPSSLAVLPFRNNVPDPELQWLGAGLADLLTTNLAQRPDVVVVGRQSLYDILTEGGLSEEEEIPEALAMTVARRAGARLLLWGSVTGAPDDMRIDAHVIELEGGTIWWADFARGGDVFELVDSLTVGLATQLTGVRPPLEAARISHLGTQDLEALGAFHRANALARAGRLEEAEAHFERAATIDSAFALPLLASRGEFASDEAEPSEEDRTESERRRASWRERREAQLFRRLPDEVKSRLAGLSGEALRAAVDSLWARSRSALDLLSGQRPPGGTRPTGPPPNRPPPRDPTQSR
ncbi:CsgG/HfaB family protein [Candidatus Palauibacter sp.]|uniref:CsgG/HfaB family protein n=1 Tax=Candidatus Palauibacter sp. TaxID=3101350 RepID=UPI003AF2BFC2